MNASWPKVPLQSLVEDGEISYGIVQPGSHVDSGVPIVRVKDLGDGRINENDPLRVDPIISTRHRRTILRGGELLLSIVGTIGETALVPYSLAGWNVARAIAVIRPQGVSSAWIQLCLQTSTVKAAVSAALNTTVQATLNLSDLKQLQIPIPPDGERGAIVEVFGAIDEKIVLARRLSGAIDELSAALWSRVRANSDWALLKDVATINAAVTRPIPGGRLRYVDISSVSVGRFDYPPITSWDDAPGRARRVLRMGDTIWSTVRPSRRSHALVLDNDPLLIGSTGLAVITPNKGRAAGVYESTRSDEFVQYLEGVAEGSAYPAVRADRFENAPIPALSADQWDEFESTALPLRMQAHVAAREMRLLMTVREELLPLVMSGILRVKDAEKVVEEVV